jgi:hypothetical protein
VALERSPEPQLGITAIVQRGSVIRLKKRHVDIQAAFVAQHTADLSQRAVSIENVLENCFKHDAMKCAATEWQLLGDPHHIYADIRSKFKIHNIATV